MAVPIHPSGTRVYAGYIMNHVLLKIFFCTLF
jgi:hypothetical protein